MLGKHEACYINHNNIMLIYFPCKSDAVRRHFRLFMQRIDKLEFIEFLKHRHRDSFAAPFDGMDYLKTVCFQPLYLPIKIVKRSNG